MNDQRQRYGHQVDDDETVHEPLPAAEAARDGDSDQRHRRNRHRDERADAEVAHRQADADELGDQREEIQDEQVANGKGSPELAEPLQD